MENIFNLSVNELQELRDKIVKQYIGEITKPYWYFDKLTDIDILINSKNQQ